MKASCSRADLVHLLGASATDLLGSCAGLLGFEKLPAVVPPAPLPPIAPKPPPLEPKKGPPPPPPPAEAKVAYLRVVAAQQKDVEVVPVRRTPWQHGERGDVLAFDPPDPLVPWPRLWRHLRRHLSIDKPTAEVDQAALVDRLSRAKTIQRLPRLRRACFASRPRLLVDTSTRLMPFWHDQDLVCRHLVRWTANDSGEPFPLVEADPILPRLHAGWPELPRPDLRGAMVLVLGDLGAYGGRQARQEWAQAAEQLKRQGAVLRALVPCPFWRVDKKLAALWNAIPWEASERRCRPLTTSEREQRADKLLTLLSPALRIELGLLRRARTLLPAGETDSGTEVDVIYHPAISDRSAVALSLDPNHKRQLESKLGELAVREGGEAVVRELRRLLERWHGRLPPEIGAEEMFHLSRLMPRLFGPGEVERYRRSMENALAAIDSADAHGMLPAGVAAWFRDFERRIPAELYADESPLGRALRRAYMVVHGEQAIEKAPFALGPEALQVLARGRALTPTRWRLWQVGRGLRTLLADDLNRPTGAPSTRRPSGSSRFTGQIGSPVAEIVAALPRVLVEVPGEGLASYPLDPRAPPIPLPETARGIVLKTDRQELTLDACERPDWAKRAGRDEFGLWAEFEYKGVVQRMRWIAPCRFWIGSPENEPERCIDEFLHQVELIDGYWLADTACTQELWVAVMGKNPSKFVDQERGKGSRPVENVSWDDCQKFLRRFNKAMPGLELRLPTEAEWENACRAGTTTPFSFGRNITPNVVNYDGNHPYAGGAKDQHRQETVPVRSLPANLWGLYEMHGNVNEWCEDVYAGYPMGAVTNPVSQRGQGHVIRGGSWTSYAKDVRSATRAFNPPDARFDRQGFRIARGRPGQQERPAGAGGARGDADASGGELTKRTRATEAAPEKAKPGKKGILRWFVTKEKM